jgi:peptidoglycan hydrolase CwlO-like protein
MTDPRKQTGQDGRGGILGDVRRHRDGAAALSPEGWRLPRPASTRRPTRTTTILPSVFLITAFLLAWVTAPAALASTTKTPFKGPFSDLTSRLEQVNADIGKAKLNAGTLAVALREADSRLLAAERDLAAAQRRFTRARRRSVEASKALSRATTEVWRQEARRARQARHTYMTGGPLTELGFLLSATTVAEAGRRYVTLSRVARDANDNLKRLKEARHRVAISHAAMVAGERDAAVERLAVAGRVEVLERAQARHAEAKRALDARVTWLSWSKASLEGRVLKLLSQVKRRDAAAHKRLLAQLRRNAKLASLAEAAAKARRAVQAVRDNGRCDLAGISPDERYLIMRESGGNPTAGNRASTAFGLGQLILSTRMRYLGDDHSTVDCGKQLKAFHRYVVDAYGSAKAARSFWRANGWY